jgi:hypothetical protein
MVVRDQSAESRALSDRFVASFNNGRGLVIGPSLVAFKREYSATETLDVYGHLWPDVEDRTRAAVDGAFGAGVALPWPTTAT